MKPLRVLVLLLLALLLPIRGVVAATMDCNAGLARHAHADVQLAAGPGAAARHPCADAVDVVQVMTDGGAPAAPGDTHAAAGDGSGGDTCHLCASGCGAAMLMAVPAPLGAPPLAGMPLPVVTLPALEFQRDGQDRPPRAR